MNKNILLKHLPGTAKYLASVFDAGLIERGCHHNYVVDRIVLNNNASLDEMTKIEKTCLDNFIHGYLVGIDKLLERETGEIINDKT